MTTADDELDIAQKVPESITSILLSIDKESIAIAYIIPRLQTAVLKKND